MEEPAVPNRRRKITGFLLFSTTQLPKDMIRERPRDFDSKALRSAIALIYEIIKNGLSLAEYLFFSPVIKDYIFEELYQFKYATRKFFMSGLDELEKRNASLNLDDPDIGAYNFMNNNCYGTNLDKRFGSRLYGAKYLAKYIIRIKMYSEIILCLESKKEYFGEIYRAMNTLSDHLQNNMKFKRVYNAQRNKRKLIRELCELTQLLPHQVQGYIKTARTYHK